MKKFFGYSNPNFKFAVSFHHHSNSIREEDANSVLSQSMVNFVSNHCLIFHFFRETR